MDPRNDTIMRVGTILEFRKSRRSMNRVALGKLAQRLFCRESTDIIYLGSESVLERVDAATERGAFRTFG